MDRKNEVPAGKENYYVLPIVNWHKVCVYRDLGPRLEHAANKPHFGSNFRQSTSMYVGLGLFPKTLGAPFPTSPSCLPACLLVVPAPFTLYYHTQGYLSISFNDTYYQLAATPGRNTGVPPLTGAQLAALQAFREIADSVKLDFWLQVGLCERV